MQELELLPSLQQATVKVHQPADDEQHAQQVLLSLSFQCPPAQKRTRLTTSQRWYAQSMRKNYHVLLFSMLVLTFFLVLELTTPTATHSVADQQPTLLAAITELLYGQL